MTPAKDRPAAGHTRDELLGAIMADVATIMRHVADWHVSEFIAVDVTMSQAKLLYLVTSQPGIVMTALAAQLGVGLSTVSGLVDRLVEHGYLQRREDPADRRQQRVTVTPEGAAVVERMREMNDHHLRTLLEGMSVPDLRTVSAGIAALGRHASRLDHPPTCTQHERKDARMIRLTEFAIRQKSVIVLLAVGLLLAGIFSWSQLRQELLPDIELPFVTVITPLAGAGAEDVATQVTEPVERSLANVPRLEAIQSTSANSLSLVFAEFSFGTDVKETLAEVDKPGRRAGAARGQRAAGELVRLQRPAGHHRDGRSDRGRRPGRGVAHRPRGARAGDPGHRGRLDRRPDRRAHADPRHHARPRGDGRRGHHPSAGPGHLFANQIAIPAGAIEEGTVRLPVSAEHRFTTVEELEGLVVGARMPDGAGAAGARPPGRAADRGRAAGRRPRMPADGGILANLPMPVTLGQIADIERHDVQVSGYARTNGQPSLTLSLTKRSGANTVEVADAVQAVFADGDRALPGHDPDRHDPGPVDLHQGIARRPRPGGPARRALRDRRHLHVPAQRAARRSSRRSASRSRS